jgi:hypothetical protein
MLTRLDNNLKEKMTMTQETIGQKSNRTGLFMGGALVLILLLAAAFMGGQLMAQGEEGIPLSNVDQSIMLQDGNVTLQDGSIAQSVQAPAIEMAPEMPARAPEATGLFVDRTDDTLTMGTGNVMAMISTEPNAVPEFSYDGIKQDILVTNRTKFYLDRTEYTFGQTSVQQKLEEVENLDMLVENSFMDVWGERSGDRIVAETIIIRLPGQ